MVHALRSREAHDPRWRSHSSEFAVSSFHVSAILEYSGRDARHPVFSKVGRLAPTSSVPIRNCSLRRGRRDQCSCAVAVTFKGKVGQPDEEWQDSPCSPKPACCCSLRLGAGETRHLAPLLRFVGDEPAESGG